MEQKKSCCKTTLIGFVAQRFHNYNFKSFDCFDPKLNLFKQMLTYLCNKATLIIIIDLTEFIIILLKFFKRDLK